MKEKKIHIIRPNEYIYPEYNILFCGLVDTTPHYQAYQAVEHTEFKKATCKSCKKAWLVYCDRNA